MLIGEGQVLVETAGTGARHRRRARRSRLCARAEVPGASESRERAVRPAAAGRGDCGGEGRRAVTNGSFITMPYEIAQHFNDYYVSKVENLRRNMNDTQVV